MKEFDNKIDLDNIMEYDGFIECGKTYTTTTGKEIYGDDFIVKDKDGKEIPNCTGAWPSRRIYLQCHIDEQGKMVITTDTGLDDGWHKYSGVLNGRFTDKDMVVEYIGGN